MLEQSDAAITPMRISTLVEQIIHVKCLMRTVETAHANMHDGLIDFLPVILWNLNILIEQIEVCCVELSSHCSEVNLDLVLDRFFEQEDFICRGKSLASLSNWIAYLFTPLFARASGLMFVSHADLGHAV